MRERGPYSSTDVDILILLHRRHEQDDTATLKDLRDNVKIKVDKKTILRSIEKNLKEFILEEGEPGKRRFRLNPEKEGEAVAIIKDYLSELDPHYSNVKSFVDKHKYIILALIVIIGLSFLLSPYSNMSYERYTEEPKPIRAYTHPDIMMGVTKINCTLINISEAGNRTLYRDPDCISLYD